MFLFDKFQKIKNIKEDDIDSFYKTGIYIILEISLSTILISFYGIFYSNDQTIVSISEYVFYIAQILFIVMILKDYKNSKKANFIINFLLTIEWFIIYFLVNSKYAPGSGSPAVEYTEKTEELVYASGISEIMLYLIPVYIFINLLLPIFQKIENKIATASFLVIPISFLAMIKFENQLITSISEYVFYIAQFVLISIILKTFKNDTKINFRINLLLFLEWYIVYLAIMLKFPGVNAFASLDAPPQKTFIIAGATEIMFYLIPAYIYINLLLMICEKINNKIVTASFLTMLISFITMTKLEEQLITSVSEYVFYIAQFVFISIILKTLKNDAKASFRINLLLLLEWFIIFSIVRDHNPAVYFYQKTFIIAGATEIMRYLLPAYIIANIWFFEKKETKEE